MKTIMFQFNISIFTSFRRSGLFMASLDVDSLLTNVPLEETIIVLIWPFTLKLTV